MRNKYDEEFYLFLSKIEIILDPNWFESKEQN